jgi:hypothetical protein
VLLGKEELGVPHQDQLTKVPEKTEPRLTVVSPIELVFGWKTWTGIGSVIEVDQARRLGY